MKKIRKSVWLPVALLLAGAAFYVWDGLRMNSWMQNLPNLIIQFLIVVALLYVLRRKERSNDWRE